MMPARNEPQLPEWLIRAIDLFDRDKFKDGDILSHHWIRFALEVPEPKTLAEADNAQWLLLARVETFREWMLESRQVALQNVRGEGYRIVPPRDQARVAAEEAMRLVKKGLQRGDKLMSNTRLADLNAEERKRHTDAQVRLAGVGQLVKRQKRDIFKLLKQ